MFSKTCAALAAGAALACAAPAAATTYYDFTLTGTITSGWGSDGLLKVGDTVTMTAHVSADFVLDAGAPGADVAGASDLHAYAWSMTAGPYTWVPTDDVWDGKDETFCSAGVCLSGPTISFSGDKITGVSGPQMVESAGDRPELDFLGAGFRILGDPHLYDNTSTPQDFVGQWDFASSSVVVSDAPGVPEPATWSMMLLGFLGLGAALRAAGAASGSRPARRPGR